MSAVVPHNEISKRVIVELFRDGLRTAIGDGTITDPVAAKRPNGSEVVHTAFPSTNVFHPHIIVQESGDTGSRVDSRVDLHEHDYSVAVTVSARNQTHMFLLRDEVRGWVLANHLPLSEGGFIDLQILSSAPVVREDDSDLVEWKLTVGGTIFSSSK